MVADSDKPGLVLGDMVEYRWRHWTTARTLITVSLTGRTMDFSGLRRQFTPQRYYAFPRILRLQRPHPRSERYPTTIDGDE